MRAPFALAVALVAVASLAAAPAQAQVQRTSTLTAELTQPTVSTLQPGDSAGMVLIAMRSCTSPADILPAGTVAYNVVASSGAVAVTGPMSAPLEQLVCAQDSFQRVDLPLNVTARSDLDLNGTTLDETLVFQVRVEAFDGIHQPPPDAVVSTLFVVKAPNHTHFAPLAASETERPAPGGGAVLAIGVVALAAFLMRRR